MILINKTKFLQILTILMAVFFISCKDKLIPEKDMVSIMVHVFLTDATVSNPQVGSLYQKKDSIEYYQSIYEPMGYSTEQFKNSINYYIKNPEMLDQLLDKVINELSQIETKLNTELNSLKQKSTEANLKNLWKSKKTWKLPNDGKQGSIDFKIELIGLGEYIISADVTVYKKDESKIPAMAAWFYYDDGTTEGIMIGEKFVYYSKDGKTRNVSLTLTVVDTLTTHLMGSLMYHQAKDGEWKKHAEVKNISITYNPLPFSYPPSQISIQKDTLLKSFKDNYHFLGQKRK